MPWSISPTPWQGDERGGAGDRGGRDPIPVQEADHSSGTCTDAEPFALRVTDDSMAPEFPAGSIVIIDPSVPAASGRFAVAETATGVCLGRLLRTGDGWQLQRLTGTATPVHVEAGAIRGIVTQRAGRRRRDHKHYP